MSKEKKSTAAREIEEDLLSYKDKPRVKEKREKVKNKREKVKVKFNNKKPSIFRTIINWIVGLYVAGIFVNIIGGASDFIYNLVVNYVLNTFFELQLGTVTSILATPIIIVFTVLPLLSMLLLYIPFKFIVERSEAFPDKQEKAFLTVTFLMFFVTILTYF